MIGLVRAQWARQGVSNLEAVEVGLRAAMNRDLCGVLEELLNDSESRVAEDRGRAGEKCHCGRAKRVETVFGSVRLWRNYYYREGVSPKL